MTGGILFDPYVPLGVLIALAVVMAVVLGVSVWRRLLGWPLRAVAAVCLLAALANPSFQREQRDGLTDIVIAVVDESSSQTLSDRAAQTDAALTRVRAEIAAMDRTELRVVRVPDGADNSGTALLAAMAEAVAQEPAARLAGAILITDGQVHDIDRAPVIDAPTHVLLTGRDTDWDRRLFIQDTPAFAILDEETTITLRVEDQGALPADLSPNARLSIAIDGAAAQTFNVPVGREIEIPLTVTHAGINVVQIAIDAQEGELTDRNNAAALRINGVRDRLRVLLVSGEPHPGERTWRNLLKSDSAVDLVHFTILRPPEKQDGVPVSELSLIAFPTRELFLEKIEEFDLIIFDRYKRRGILPSVYLDNVRQYVENGGAVLIAAGPDFASADSLFRSPLSEILPAAPTSRVIEDPYLPAITDTGARHPVTAGMQDDWLRQNGDEPWGRWVRQVELDAGAGDVVMSGHSDSPLLVLNREGEGRVALLGSDHAWLWSRGFEGGGPQLDLLRRLAHWMMKEPELEEEALTAISDGRDIEITRRTLAQGARDVTLTTPSGEVVIVPLTEEAAGRFTAQIEDAEIGLYRIRDADLETVVAVGPAAPKEFENTIASTEILEPVMAQARGGSLRLEDGMPDIRQVREGRVASGRGWIGITPRQAFVTTDVMLFPLAPAWLMLMLVAAMTLWGWLREGRR
ncbi:hypothetical protein [Rhodovulum sp. FJ3]|uniref:hypothetical protein n=1 Tax=Rhodovulum sp. FJ3 TaxID=3079053 RepID=UPI00293DB8CE|nr:hypothetical protein [Rhodovulum sp. FJ3]MDV4169302.1 hypothetical protein [Rhodovulum sp. FJ3]